MLTPKYDLKFVVLKAKHLFDCKQLYPFNKSMNWGTDSHMATFSL